MLGEIRIRRIRIMLKIQHYFPLCIGLVGLILSTGCSPVYAQDITCDSSAQFYWFNAGGGASSVQGGLGESSFGVSPGVSFSYQLGNNLFSVRHVYNVEFQIHVFGESSTPEAVWDVGALYGRIAKASYGFASISGGISIVGEVRPYKERTFLTAGIPFETQLFWTPLPSFGIGIYGFANLNREKSFVGALLCIQIGKLR